MKKINVYLAVGIFGAIVVNVVLLLAYVALSTLLLHWNSGDMRMRVPDVAVAKKASACDMAEADSLEPAVPVSEKSQESVWKKVKRFFFAPGTWLAERCSNALGRVRAKTATQSWYDTGYTEVFGSPSSLQIDGLWYHGPVMAPYPVRDKGDARERKPLVVSAEDALLWLSHPGFFEPKAIEGVQPRVIKAKAHLNDLFKSGKLKRRLSPEQIVAICLREAQYWNKDDQDGLYIDLNCLGDLSYAGDEKAHGPIQISLRAHDSVDAIEGFGLRSTDFLGDLALSEMVYQAWVCEHVPEFETPELTFQWASRYWNGGPTGAQGKYFSKALRYWNGSSERAGVKGFYAMVTELPVYTELVAFRKTGGKLQIVHESEDAPTAVAVKDSRGTLLPVWVRHPHYGTVFAGPRVTAAKTSLFPDGRIEWASAEFGTPDAKQVSSQ